ncbi:MAG: hypothetical protein AVDCRST_MAG96-3495 [uncultured Segetibacter sp.]|uniref:Uncharacterized protein n=1 Tax=uncultured Segetibacter sp. TaxID=481133 RepID=A0A6J4TRD3_9BACT|nr:MAG: hypothetical protein AVDCRST_MAG96-3495 [uncultured Segetibacter sp.]
MRVMLIESIQTKEINQTVLAVNPEADAFIWFKGTGAFS